MAQAGVVLILGSAPAARAVVDWDLSPFDQVVVINNAWRLRSDWTVLIHPEDFPQEARPEVLASGQRVVGAGSYVGIQNRYGGFVYAGGTMAFTAGYWALGALQPRVLAWFGCDMVYPKEGRTHFYGTGAADPLRNDISLRNLEAKAARLQILAARDGCACVNLSRDESRLVFPRAEVAQLRQQGPVRFDPKAVAGLVAEEERLGYFVPSGRYWEVAERFDPMRIDALDEAWLRLHSRT